MNDERALYTWIIGLLIAAFSAVTWFLFRSTKRDHNDRIRALEEHQRHGITRYEVQVMIDKTMEDVRRQHGELLAAINRGHTEGREDMMNFANQIDRLRDEIRELYERRKTDRQ